MADLSEHVAQEHLLKGRTRLRFKNPADSLQDEIEGVRRWWWEFLRLSKPYWLVCQTSTAAKVQTQDKELTRVYRAFGDIYSCTFEDWWLERGSWVFREKDVFPKVTALVKNPRERAQQRYLDDHLWVDIPLKLSRRTIQRQIGRILDQHQQLRLRNRLELSTSSFKVNPVRFRLLTLKTMHEVYCLHRELIGKPAVQQPSSINGGYNTRADLFRIGKLLRISPSNEELRGESSVIFKRQNRMRASVSRLLKRAELLIANAELGSFPTFKPVISEGEQRFNQRQCEMHQELEARWWALDLTSTLSAGKIDVARRIHYHEAEKEWNRYSSDL
jgi:hypothetical protein